MNSTQNWKSLKLAHGLAKSMPALLSEIRKIKIEENNHRLWISRVEAGSPRKVNVCVEIAHINGGELKGMTVNALNGKLGGRFGRLLYKGDPIVAEVHDGFY